MISRVTKKNALEWIGQLNLVAGSGRGLGYSPDAKEQVPVRSSAGCPLALGSHSHKEVLVLIYLLLALTPTQLIELGQLLLSQYTFPNA